MTPKERKVVFTLIGIMVVILLIVVCVKAFGNGGNDNNTNNTGTLNTTTNNTAQNEEKYVTELNDGTKINNSNDLKGVKTYKSLEISNIQFTSRNGGSTILADVKNNGTTTFEGEIIKLTLIGENGEAVLVLNATLPRVEAGKTEQLNHMMTADVVNVKDFKIEAK